MCFCAGLGVVLLFLEKFVNCIVIRLGAAFT